MHTPVDGVSTITGMHVPATKSGVVVGVKRCKSAWVCPVCASQITEVRRRELGEALAAWRNPETFNGRVVMATYTFRHQAGMLLPWMVDRLNAAFRAMTKTGAYGRLLKRYGLAGSVASRETKHSMANGHHPHIHKLLFVPQDTDIQALECELRAMWETAAARAGLSMNQHGFALDDCDEHIAEYVAKWGHEPAWTEAEETTKWHLKKKLRAQDAQGRRADEHYTPFQLLRFAHEGDEEAGKLFVEYAQAFRGRAQLRWSKGFRAFLGLDEEKSDEECLETEQIGEVMVVLDVVEEWSAIVANDAVGEFVACLAAGDMARLCAFLGLLGIYRDVGEPLRIDLKNRKRRRALWGRKVA
ncbi:MAG: protein rep [Terriglobia bacterium]